MENKTFERLAIMLMSAILMALLFCAYMLVKLSNKHDRSERITHYNQTDDGVSQLQVSGTIAFDSTNRTITIK